VVQCCEDLSTSPGIYPQKWVSYPHHYVEGGASTIAQHGEPCRPRCSNAARLAGSGLMPPPDARREWHNAGMTRHVDRRSGRAGALMELAHEFGWRVVGAAGNDTAAKGGDGPVAKGAGCGLRWTRVQYVGRSGARASDALAGIRSRAVARETQANATAGEVAPCSGLRHRASPAMARIVQLSSGGWCRRCSRCT